MRARARRGRRAPFRAPATRATRARRVRSRASRSPPVRPSGLVRRYGTLGSTGYFILPTGHFREPRRQGAPDVVGRAGPPPEEWRGGIRTSRGRAHGDPFHAGPRLGRGAVAQSRVQALPVVQLDG